MKNPSIPLERRDPDESALAVVRDDLERHGSAFLRSVFVDWVLPLRTAVSSMIDGPAPSRISRPHGAASGRSMRDDEVGAEHPTIIEFLQTSGVGALAAALLERDVMVLRSVSMFAKEPGCPVGSPWHHDRPTTAPITGERVLNLWIALDRAVPATGSLQVLAGSHRWGRDRVERFVEAVPKGSAPDPDGASVAAPWGEVACSARSVQPGDVVAIDGMSIHGAAGNAGRTTVCALSTFWWGGNPRPHEFGPR